MAQQQNAIELRNITKTFGSVCANKNVSLNVRQGEILALLGENGSGKTTLMNMLSGIYFPDSGEIFVNGSEVVIRSPKDAFALHIGMIHQHFKLVDVLTAAENIVLGLKGSLHVDRAAVAKEIKAISSRYGFLIDPNKKIYDMSVSEKQTVEIIKVLYRGANTLILDEPTAVLTPQEADRLFEILRNMRNDGKSIIIITHKLYEVLDISDRVSILRRGECVDTVETKDATIQSLTEGMVGRSISLEIERDEPQSDAPDVLKISSLTCVNAEGVSMLNNATLTVRGGEILGVAGVAGSGQRELCEAIAGLYPVQSGSIKFLDNGCEYEIVGLTPPEIVKKNIHTAFVPEDRLGMGLVGGLDMVENMMLKNYNARKGFFVDRKTPKKLADELISKLAIVTPGTATPVRRLSGGNVQKVLLGREIASLPAALVVAYPVRGLDINSSYTIYNLLNEQKKRGVAVLFVGEDLDVLLELCDRIVVLSGGYVSGIVDARTITKEEVGLLMTNVKHGVNEQQEGVSA